MLLDTGRKDACLAAESLGTLLPEVTQKIENVHIELGGLDEGICRQGSEGTPGFFSLPIVSGKERETS